MIVTCFLATHLDIALKIKALCMILAMRSQALTFNSLYRNLVARSNVCTGHEVPSLVVEFHPRENYPLVPDHVAVSFPQIRR